MLPYRSDFRAHGLSALPPREPAALKGYSLPVNFQPEKLLKVILAALPRGSPLTGIPRRNLPAWGRSSWLRRWTWELIASLLTGGIRMDGWASTPASDMKTAAEPAAVDHQAPPGIALLPAPRGRGISTAKSRAFRKCGAGLSLPVCCKPLFSLAGRAFIRPIAHLEVSSSDAG
jgi:hypothetical protein